MKLEVPLKGVSRRSSNGAVYFEKRYSGPNGGGRFYTTKIKSAEEGGLCYDILQRYMESGTGSGVQGKRKLNYPEYSRSLKLEPLPSNFDIRHNKEEAMEIILRQAQTAAKNLPGSLKQPPRVSEVKQNVRDFCTNIEVQKYRQEIFEHSHQCDLLYSLKVEERKELERKVTDIKEDSGIIHCASLGPDKFYYHVACLQQLLSTDESIPWLLTVAVQGYKSEESKCWEQRKILEDHNLKSIPGSLMGDGNIMAGRQRANENERLPEVLEVCPPEEQNECSVPVDCRREDEEERFAEVCSSSNAGVPFPHWTDFIDAMD